MLIPRNWQVLIKREAVPARTAGGLHIPESAQDWRSNYATVIRAGAKCDTVKAGDRILLHHYGGVEVRDNGELVALIVEDQIFAVVDPPLGGGVDA